MRRQNPLELVFEDISTFNAENSIVGSLLREIDIKKKQSDSDFVKLLPSHPGKEFEIKKKLDKLRGINTSFSNNNSNNNNNNNTNNSNLFGPGGDPLSLPTIEDFLDGGTRPLPPPLPGPSVNLGKNLFKSEPPVFRSLTSEFDVSAKIRAPPPNISATGIGNDLFGSQAASAIRENKTKTQQEVDDFLYEMTETMPDLVLGDELANALGTDTQSLFDQNASPTKKEEEDEILKGFMEEYDIENIRNTMDETAQVPESIYFFYGGESEEFVKALEFIGLSPINREFGAFLLSDLGRKTLTENKLSIHVGSGDIFYDNHNTGENFYIFLLSQQNDETAFVTKKNSYRNSFEAYIGSFLQSFSIDDQEKFDLLAFKNSKYLFYRFNDFVKAYGNPRYKIFHTKKMLNSF